MPKVQTRPGALPRGGTNVPPAGVQNRTTHVSHIGTPGANAPGASNDAPVPNGTPVLTAYNETAWVAVHTVRSAIALDGGR
jgi:hypothetical protein